MIVGEGSFRYELVQGWSKMPASWDIGDVPDVAVDSHDRVYVFTRSEHPVVVMDRDGNVLKTFGEGVFGRPHGVTITPDDRLWATDDFDHTVRLFTLDGKLLQTLGTKNQPSDTGYDSTATYSLATIKRGAGPFNRPTKVAEAANGDVYVSDGYGNARVHRFTAAGEYVGSWGEPGNAPGQFNLPHTVSVHPDGRVFICDRENCRVQIFSPEGKLLDSWDNLVKPSELIFWRDGYVYMVQGGVRPGEISMAGDLLPVSGPSCVSIRNQDGSLVTSWGDPDPFAPVGFGSAHGIAVDSRGDVYVGEVAKTALGRAGLWKSGYPSLRKFTRV
jgi:WD40 repeat protein